MKTMLFTVACAVFLSCSNETPKVADTTIAQPAGNNMPLVGTWKELSGSTTRGDSVSMFDSKLIDKIKIVTPTHFAWQSRKVSDKSFIGAISGKVTMDSTNYTEEILYSSNPGIKATTVAKFTYKVEGDKWYHKGGFAGYEFEEVWQRVK